MDCNAEFDVNNVWIVHHSKCGNPIRMNEPYSTLKFRKHLGLCKGDKKRANTSRGTLMLHQMANTFRWGYHGRKTRTHIEILPL
jgi:hypothetical protein